MLRVTMLNPKYNMIIVANAIEMIITKRKLNKIAAFLNVNWFD